MPSRRLLPLLILILLAACAGPKPPWQPTIDMGNDKHIDTLKSDLAACKFLAQQAGEKALTPRTRSIMTTEDGITINGSVYRHGYTNCMKERHHPVID